MNTTYILVLELFDLLCDNVVEHVMSGRASEALACLAKMKQVRNHHIERVKQVLGLQKLAQEVAKLQSEMGYHVNPLCPPDQPGLDTIPPVPTDE